MATIEARNVVAVAIDDSEYSMQALQFYLNTLHRANATVVILHCMEFPYVPTLVRNEVMTEHFEQARQQAKEIEAKYVKILNDKQIPNKVIAEFGEPGEFICDSIKKAKATMIVMGTRGHGSVRRTIMGSVSSYVVHHAHCPVVISRH